MVFVSVSPSVLEQGPGLGGPRSRGSSGGSPGLDLMGPVLGKHVDSLRWGRKPSQGHLLLQQKINRYLFHMHCVSHDRCNSHQNTSFKKSKEQGFEE